MQLALERRPVGFHFPLHVTKVAVKEFTRWPVPRPAEPMQVLSHDLAIRVRPSVKSERLRIETQRPAAGTVDSDDRERRVDPCTAVRKTCDGHG